MLRELRSRAVDLELGPDETPEAFERRLETALMVLFRDTGSESAFQALYEYARGDLFVWIASLSAGGNRRFEAHEVLQDAFINIYRYAAGFRDDDPRSFRVWSRTIAGNLVRRSRNRGTRSLSALPKGMEEPADLRAGPSEELVAEEDERSLARAWILVLLQYAAAYEHLSPRDRLALDLIEVQGLSYAEAGRALSVGISNMKMIMFRSRKRIRALMTRMHGPTFAPRRDALAG